MCFRARWWRLVKRGDCLLAISTSGKSRNVIRAAEAARGIGHAHDRTARLATAAPLRSVCDQAIIVPSQVTARIQEAHIFIGHTLCSLVEQALSLA